MPRGEPYSRKLQHVGVQLLREDPQYTMDQIARREGVAPTTVGKVAKELNIDGRLYLKRVRLCQQRAELIQQVRALNVLIQKPITKEPV